MKARETQHKIEQNNFVSKIENLEAVKQGMDENLKKRCVSFTFHLNF